MTAAKIRPSAVIVPAGTAGLIRNLVKARTDIKKARQACRRTEAAYKTARSNNSVADQAHRRAKAAVDQARDDLTRATAANAAERWAAYSSGIEAETQAAATGSETERELEQSRRNRDRDRQTATGAKNALNKAGQALDRATRQQLAAN